MQKYEFSNTIPIHMLLILLFLAIIPLKVTTIQYISKSASRIPQSKDTYYQNI